MESRQNNAETPGTGNIEQYKSYLQDVGNIGTRHESSRRFYLSVLSALFVLLSMAGKEGPLKILESPIRILVGLAGIILCAAWFMHMRSYGAIYQAKFEALRAMEKECKLFPLISKEWEHLQANPDYKLLTGIDSVIPSLFAALFIALLYFMIAANL